MLLAPTSHTINSDISINDAIDLVSPILYFDIFNYPLSLSEIHSYTKLKIEPEVKLKQWLAFFVELDLIQYADGFYGIKNIENNISRRKLGNVMAKTVLAKAEKYISLISKFPFVRAIFISGSLSKNYADVNSDVDYFIVAQKNRLWVCRTLLVVFKKIFLFNSKKYFCVNYFVGTDNLEIPDKNIFTATEIATLLPVHNQQVYHTFLSSNKWVFDFFPNKQNNAISHDSINMSTNYFEFIFAGKFGNWLDDFFMRVTLSRWKSKFSDFDSDLFNHAFRSRKNVSKHHPNNFQNIVLNELAIKKQKFIEAFNTAIYK
jgi:hypothetical protein